MANVPFDDNSAFHSSAFVHLPIKIAYASSFARSRFAKKIDLTDYYGNVNICLISVLCLLISSNKTIIQRWKKKRGFCSSSFRANIIRTGLTLSIRKYQ